MKLILSKTGLNFKKKPVCLATIGVFDGVHKGHVYLIQRAKSIADRRGLKTLLISFHPHPGEFSDKDFSGYLTTQDEKAAILRDLGLDYFWNIKYNERIKKMQGHQFIDYVLGFFEVREFLVGKDFKFGYKADDDLSDLIRICKKDNIKVSTVNKKKVNNLFVNSSYIRKLVQKAEFRKARVFLGRDYSISGIVEKGSNIGSTVLDVPTVNISILNKIVPPSGVYLTKVKYKNKIYPGVSNLGFSPTFKKGKPLLEVHLINFNKTIYKDRVEVVFLKKMRAEKRFNSPTELKIQIEKDISIAKKEFSRHNILCLR